LFQDHNIIAVFSHTSY